MAELTTSAFLVAVILGIVLAIAYSLRFVVIMERRIARIEGHLEQLAKKILMEEKAIRKSLGKKRRRK